MNNEPNFYEVSKYVLQKKKENLKKTYENITNIRPLKTLKLYGGAAVELYLTMHFLPSKERLFNKARKSIQKVKPSTLELAVAAVPGALTAMTATAAESMYLVLEHGDKGVTYWMGAMAATNSLSYIYEKYQKSKEELKDGSKQTKKKT